MQTFGVTVIEAPHALQSDDWLYRHPEARADDLHWALTNPDVDGIVTTIGGDDSVRILRHLDLELIRSNPKVFIGFSDTTVQHVAFYLAGVTSFYGPSILTGFAENGGIFPYTTASLRSTLFGGDGRVSLTPADQWTEEHLDWSDPGLQLQLRKLEPNPGWIWLQGGRRAQGRLLGGCLEVLEMLKGTPWWPSLEHFDGAVLYLETSELAPPLDFVTYWLRNYVTQGIMERVSGLLLGRPQGYTEPMKEELYRRVKLVASEAGRGDMPIVANMDFGHTSPTCVLPNGCRVAIDPFAGTIEVVESCVR